MQGDTRDAHDHDGAGAADLGTLAIAQRILDGPWRHAAARREACAAGRWPDFVRSTAPVAPRLLGRWDHAACVRAASALFEGPRDVVVEIVPIWVADADDEVPTTTWCTAHAVRVEDGAFDIREIGPHTEDADVRLDVHVTARARAWRAGLVVPSRSYAPSVGLVLRRGAFGVLASDVDALADVRPHAGSPLPRPARHVPPFSRAVEPRVDGLSGAVVAALRELGFEDPG